MQEVMKRAEAVNQSAGEKDTGTVALSFGGRDKDPDHVETEEGGNDHMKGNPPGHEPNGENDRSGHAGEADEASDRDRRRSCFLRKGCAQESQRQREIGETRQVLKANAQFPRKPVDQAAQQVFAGNQGTGGYYQRQKTQVEGTRLRA